MISTKLGSLHPSRFCQYKYYLAQGLCITCAIVCVKNTHTPFPDPLFSYNGRTCPKAGSTLEKRVDKLEIHYSHRRVGSRLVVCVVVDLIALKILESCLAAVVVDDIRKRSVVIVHS